MIELAETERSILSRWAKLGALFSVGEAWHEPDLEALLVESMEFCAENPRLFKMAVSWLAEHGHLVARYRLASMIRHQLPQRHHGAVMGLMLDVVGHFSPRLRSHFNLPLGLCQPAEAPAVPLFDVMRKHAIFIERVEHRAWPISRKWNLLIEPFELKNDAIRPLEAILERNPAMRFRDRFRGKLPASIIAELMHDPDVGESECALARRLGVTRPALRHAIQQGVDAGYLKRKREGRNNRVLLRQGRSNQFTTRVKH